MNWDFAQYLVEGEKEKDFGRFVLEPLPKGMAGVVGNAMRRVILSAVPGVAVTAIVIENVLHEFTTLQGLYEDIPDFVLNVRDVVFRMTGQERAVVRLECTGEKEIKAGDMILPLGVEVLNPDHYICRLNRSGKLFAELHIGIGRGFVPEEENKAETLPINTIFVNSNFSPVKRVNYRIEQSEEGHELERLILDVRTNGSVSPARAMKIGSVYLNRILGIMKEIEETSVTVKEEEELYAEDVNKKNILDMPVSELGLSRRSSNCLKAGEINTISQLISMNRNELMNLKNFGRKSLDEIREKLLEYQLNLKDDTGDEDLPDDTEEEFDDEA